MTDKSTHGCLCGKTTFINPHWGKQDKKLKRYRLIEHLIIISEPVKLKYQYKFKNRKKSWSVEAFLIAIARILSLETSSLATQGSKLLQILKSLYNSLILKSSPF